MSDEPASLVIDCSASEPRPLTLEEELEYVSLRMEVADAIDCSVGAELRDEFFGEWLRRVDDG